MNIRETVEALMYELNMAIDEVNTMRDIHHTDNFTPADHWDKETLHDAQISLRDFIENSAATLSDKIETHHNGNQTTFAKSQGVSQSQARRWLKRNCVVIDGAVYCEVSKQVKKEPNNE
ncbi:MAG: hypothetical protein JKY50_00425 [Oleispira sp.]|nr:hypothetical protein [Oleispira sp.]